MANGYNQVTLIGKVQPNIAMKPYRNGLLIRFFLQVDGLDYDPVYRQYRRHTEKFRIVFEGKNGVPYDTVLCAHPLIQVTGKLHVRNFKEKSLGDKAFSAEIRTTRKGIVFLEDLNAGDILLFYNDPRTEITGNYY